MDITALLSQRVATASSVPAADSAGGFANVLQSVAARVAANQTAPQALQPTPVPPLPDGLTGAGVQPPSQFTVAELGASRLALATTTAEAESDPVAASPMADELIAATDLSAQSQAMPPADPGTIAQTAAQSGTIPTPQDGPMVEPWQPGTPQGPLLPATATASGVPDDPTITGMAPIAAAVAATLPGTGAPTARTLAQSEPAAPRATASAASNPGLLQSGPNLASDPSLAAANPVATDTLAASTATAPGVTPPLPEVDWSRRGPGEQQRSQVETGASATLTGTAPTGSTASAQQPPLSSMLQASLSAPVASPAWQQQLGSQLTGLAQRGRHQIELHLNPADLGPLSVSLKVDDQGAQAQFLSAHASVRAAVEQAIPQLREALAEQGIALGETSVGEQQHQGNEQSGSRQESVAAGLVPAAGNLAESREGTATTASSGDLGGVDIYA